MREILPFDENTSSNDQSLVIQSVDFERLVSSCYADSTIRQEKANGLGLLQRQAINIRKLIRVKMADESDLKQVCNAVVYWHGVVPTDVNPLT